MIDHGEGHIDSSGGLRLYERWWSPEEPRALVAIVHGYGDHCARYEPTARHLAGNGFAVQAFDLRGHGRSKGRRCYVRAFGDYLDDLGAVLRRMTRRWPERPVFLLAHSLGGLIASLFAIEARAELSGLVLSAPAVQLGQDFSKFEIRASLVLGRLLPLFPMSGIRSASISRDPAVVNDYREDPLVHHGRTPARTASEVIRAIRRIESDGERIEVPLLLMHGGQDQVADIAGSREFYQRVRSNDKRMRVLDGLYHDILNEPERASVLEEISGWLNERSGQAAAEERVAVRASI
jgi:alpha-beta hydrolase superfamily lysophospholipase